jgi:hypothetical protein
MNPAKRKLFSVLVAALFSVAGAAVAQTNARSFLQKRHDSLLSILRRPARTADSLELNTYRLPT